LGSFLASKSQAGGGGGEGTRTLTPTVAALACHAINGWSFKLFIKW